jgi:uncharacterized protein (TIGR02246 family)
MNAADPVSRVRDVLARLQAVSTDNDVDAACDLFTEDAVLMGTAATNIGAGSIRDYLTLVYGQPGTLRWIWDDVRVLHDSPGFVLAAATGVVGFDDNQPFDQFRLSLAVIETETGWRILHFHGSIPQT